MYCANDERFTIENNKLRKNNNIKMRRRKIYIIFYLI